MSLKDQITEDMKTAMRARDTARLGTIRLLLAAAKQREVDERIVLDDAAMIAIVDKESASKIQSLIKEPTFVIGELISGSKKVQLI